MINLLPPAVKVEYHYGRRNRILRHWLIGISVVIIGAILLTAGGAIYLRALTNDYNEQIAQKTEALDPKKVATIQKQVTTISNNLKLATQVLSKEILFSELLKKLGSITPANVVMTNLAISQTQGAIDISAQAGSYQAATQFATNLSDPENRIFSKADIINITCPPTAPNPAYPCTGTYRALFATDNPFLFINNGKPAAKP